MRNCQRSSGINNFIACIFFRDYLISPSKKEGYNSTLISEVLIWKEIDLKTIYNLITIERIQEKVMEKMDKTHFWTNSFSRFAENKNFSFSAAQFL